MRQNKTVALILCITLGYLGIHRFYVGKKKSGVLYLCTMGLCGIGWIVDIVLICTDRFTDWNGRQLSGATAPISAAPTSNTGVDKSLLSRYESEGKKHLKNGDYGLYRNTRLNIAQFLQADGDYNGAITMWAEVLFWDLSGLGNGFKYDSFVEITLPMLFPYEKSLIMIAPAVIRETEKCKEKLGVSDEQLKVLILNSIQKIVAPVHLFTYSEIADMYFWERDDNKTQMKKVFATAKKRFKP